MILYYALNGAKNDHFKFATFYCAIVIRITIALLTFFSVSIHCCPFEQIARADCLYTNF